MHAWYESYIRYTIKTSIKEITLMCDQCNRNQNSGEEFRSGCNRCARCGSEWENWDWNQNDWPRWGFCPRCGCCMRWGCGCMGNRCGCSRNTRECTRNTCGCARNNCGCTRNNCGCTRNTCGCTRNACGNFRACEEVAEETAENGCDC